jgi:hypothetical protein
LATRSAIRVTRAEDVLKRLSTPPERLSDEGVRVGARRSNLRSPDTLTIVKTTIYELWNRSVSGSDDKRAETTGLNSGEVLATLKDLEMERHHSAIAGSQLPRVFFERLKPRPNNQDAPEPSPDASGNEQGRVGHNIDKVARRTQTA